MKAAKAKKPASNIGKYGLPIREGAECRICKRKWKDGDRPFHTHHLRYLPPVLATLCPACHIWMSGQGKVFNHPIKKMCLESFGAEEGKALAPWEFCLRVVEMYEELLVFPANR
ncbi:MAG: hypothetical protein MZV70_03425 [Desulfobacterales bacterium]|nr:hypothetical protein [Desulfobacterales bacterium]